MAAITVGGDGKGPFAVMAGSAGLSFFHLGHGYGFFISGNDFSIVAAPAGAFGFSNMCGVAESCFAKSLDLVGHVTRFTFVAPHTVFLGRNTECLHPGVTGSAGFGLFHLCHGKVLAIPQVEDGIMADFAFIVVLIQMICVTENDRVGVFEGKLYILGLCSSGTDGRKQHDRTGE
jgi:hypothetical protein